MPSWRRLVDCLTICAGARRSHYADVARSEAERLFAPDVVAWQLVDVFRTVTSEC
jgi:hypothetical protein